MKLPLVRHAYMNPIRNVYTPSGVLGEMLRHASSCFVVLHPLGAGRPILPSSTDVNVANRNMRSSIPHGDVACPRIYPITLLTLRCDTRRLIEFQISYIAKHLKSKIMDSILLNRLIHARRAGASSPSCSMEWSSEQRTWIPCNSLQASKLNNNPYLPSSERFRSLSARAALHQLPTSNSALV